MFERYLTDALTTHFGKIIYGLDSDKVRLSAWNGELILDDLSLRPNALEHFIADCPVDIAYGKVGNLELRIPWKLFYQSLGSRKTTDQSSLSKNGMSLVLTDVNILITPRRRETTNKDKEKEEDSAPHSLEEIRTQKEKQVQTLLIANLLRRVTLSSVSSSRWSWVQDWLSSLLSTLSVTVRNIHIRYEDPGTSMGYIWSSNNSQNVRRYRPAFAVGITLHQFSVQTDDPKKEGPIQEESDATRQETDKDEMHSTRHTVIGADRLAIYWDSDIQLMSIHASKVYQSESKPELVAYYQSSFQVLNDGESSSFAHESLYQQGHSYILDPISPSVELNLASRLKEKPQESFDAEVASDSEDSTTDSVSVPPKTTITPPSSVAIDLPPCKFTFSRSTLEDTAYIRKSLSVWNHATKGVLSETSLRRLARLRPSQSPLNDPRSWWIYAHEATLVLSRVNRGGRDFGHLDFYRKRKRGWLGLAQTLGRRQRYVQLYKQLLNDADNDSDPENLSQVHNSLLAIEDGLLPEEIAAFRISFYESADQSEAKEITSPRSAQTSGWKGWMSKISRSRDLDVDDNTDTDDDDKNILSIDHRCQMMEEMMLALEKEKTIVRHRMRDVALKASTRDMHLNDLDLSYSNPVIWKAALVCREFALQVNDVPTAGSQGRQITPVIRISSALIHDQSWYHDGSWDADCALASLAVKDLNPTRPKGNTSQDNESFFPNLIGRKQSGTASGGDDFIFIQGIRYHRSLSINIRRKLNWKVQDGIILRSDVDRGSTTTTQMRILPMEVVYSTVPVEALSRVLATIKTPELADDYHRMASAAHKWQENKKKKILQALAHKHKKIIVDIDVGAPELLIPEDFTRPESPMLAIDLGKLQFFNESSPKNACKSGFDDQWRLLVSNIQVRSTTVASYYSTTTSKDASVIHSNPTCPRQLVEPFSLDFEISTKIASVDVDSRDQTRIQVSATLPRLAFNLTSSAMRLVLRLQEQWKNRKIEMEARAKFFQRTMDTYTSPRHSLRSPSRRELYQHNSSIKQPTSVPQDNGIIRTTHFHFGCPRITLRLDNDVDGRDTEVVRQRGTAITQFSNQTPLVDLAFRGIRGNVVQDVARNGASTTIFDARLHSFGAIDLYQNAGKYFTLLMSSVPQEILVEQLFDGQEYSWESAHGDFDSFNDLPDSVRRKDLVTIEYSSKSSTPLSSTDHETSDDVADKLSIWFHELYVEWNPETLAAIQKAVRMPSMHGDPTAQETKMAVHEEESVSDDEFFDAVEHAAEDEFFDAGSETNSVIHLISEVSSASHLEPSHLHISATKSNLSATSLNIGSFPGLTHQPIMPLSPPRIAYSASAPLSPFSFVASPVRSPPKLARKQKPFEVVFELSKLRVSFNKEARHRTVMIAQMDGTSVSYTTRADGGSRTTISIGNLVFIDPAHDQRSTLYRQILGLKSADNEQIGETPSSLLEMEIFINPKTRNFSSVIDENEGDPCSRSVTIDCEHGIVTGCNYFVRATFSPMRFVFLEQLWFEIIGMLHFL